PLRVRRQPWPTPVPAFVLLRQEADAAVLALARRLGLTAFFAPTRVGAGTERGIALLATRPLVNARAIELPRERQRRMAIAAITDVDGPRLLVANVPPENRP